MRRSGSHLAALVAIPVLFTLAYSMRLIERGIEASAHRVEAKESQAVLNEARILADSVQGGVETIRNQVRRMVDRPLSVLDSAIIHVAELEVRNDRIVGVKQAQILGTRISTFQGSAGFFEGYLRSAIGKLDLAEIRRNGEAMLRIKRDPQHRDEWLAFAFPLSPSGNIVLALVDPTEAFPVFKEWAERGTGAMNRGYLITGDGYVFAHSDRGLWGADFSGTGIYRDGLEKFFEASQRREGAGTFSSIDLNSASSAWLRIGALPMAVVAENVVPQDQGASGHLWQELLPSLFLLALGTLSLMAGAIYLLSRKFAALELNTGAFSTVATSSVAEAPTSTLAEVLAQTAVPPPAPKGMGLQQQQNRQQNQIKSQTQNQDETQKVLGQELDRVLAMPLARSSLIPAQTQIRPELEAAIAQLGQAQDGRNVEVNLRMRHQDEILLSQYEADSTKIKDLRQAAVRLTAASSRIFEAPALFFGYHPGVHAAILQSHAGFPGGREPSGMSFPVAEAVLDKIFEVEHTSSLAALAEFTPLHRLMATNFSGRGFQAWAVTGFAPSIRELGGPRLLGVLVLLDSARSVYLRQKPDQQGALLLMLVRLLKATSLSYENALLTS